MGGKTLQNLDDRNSEVRNSALLSFYNRSHQALVLQQRVREVVFPLTIRQLERSNLVPPLFLASPDQVKVVIYRHAKYYKQPVASKVIGNNTLIAAHPYQIFAYVKNRQQLRETNISA